MELKKKIAEDQEHHTTLVCVTGAAGFIASWIVKYLLDRGYRVRGTVRDPSDASKVEHLLTLRSAKDRLELVPADLLDKGSLVQAVSGADVVLHTACPCPEASSAFQISNPHAELVDPSVNGTLNVLEACREGGVSTVVMTSSVGAMYLNPDLGIESGRPLDESCWSDLDYLVKINEWYCLAKTLAEKAAWKFAQENHLRLMVINPAVVMGPLLQSKLNASSTHILKYLTGSVRTYANRCQAYVDVRDVALSHICAFEQEGASGRYFLAECSVHRGDLVEILREMYPEFPVPGSCSGGEAPKAVPYRFSNAKAVKLLGREMITLKECLKDSVESLVEKGFLTTPEKSVKSSST